MERLESHLDSARQRKSGYGLLSSAIFEQAAQQWHTMRSDFLGHVDSEYDKALEACSGVLVNKEGRSQHVDGYHLFTGSTTAGLPIRQ